MVSIKKKERKRKCSPYNEQYLCPTQRGMEAWPAGSPRKTQVPLSEGAQGSSRPVQGNPHPVWKRPPGSGSKSQDQARHLPPQITSEELDQRERPGGVQSWPRPLSSSALGDWDRRGVGGWSVCHSPPHLSSSDGGGEELCLDMRSTFQSKLIVY